MENFHIEVEHLRSIFKCNNCPVNITDQCIKKFFDKCTSLNRLYQQQLKDNCQLFSHFQNFFFLKMRKRLYKSVRKSLPQSNITVVFRSKNRFRSLFEFKDFIPLYLRSHFIYKFQCCYCNTTYYGKTERHLQVRAGEHISTSPLTRKMVNNDKKIFC